MSRRNKDLQPLPRDGEPISKHDEVFFEMSEDMQWRSKV
jgi:hypothetical protein